MSLNLVFLLAVAIEIIVADPSSTNDRTCGFGYELLEHHLDQIELNQQKGFSEQNSTLNNQSLLLERLVKGLTLMVDRQIRHEKRIIESCEDVSSSGRYRLQLPNRSAPVTVVCEMEPFDGGWLVIQFRFDGSVNFNRSWVEYRDGFGIVGRSNEFWLGLETIHQLTKNGDHELVVQLKNETGKYGFEEQGYKLAPLGAFSGNIFSRLNYSRDEQFSAFDRDVDQLDDGNCAQKYGGGWWFYNCGWTTLNAPFKRDENTGRGMYWEDWTSAATYSRMMIRRR